MTAEMISVATTEDSGERDKIVKYQEILAENENVLSDTLWAMVNGKNINTPITLEDLISKMADDEIYSDAVEYFLNESGREQDPERANSLKSLLLESTMRELRSRLKLAA